MPAAAAGATAELRRTDGDRERAEHSMRGVSVAGGGAVAVLASVAAWSSFFDGGGA